MIIIHIIHEIWKDIPGYEGLYKVSNKGQVKSLAREVSYANSILPRKYDDKILKPEITADGHMRVVLTKDKKTKKMFIHRLVAYAFIDNPNNYPVINHIDGNPQNNIVTNLEWCTVQWNTLHAYTIGLNNIEKTRLANSIPVIMINTETGETIEYPSMISAAKEFNMSVTTISNICAKKNNYKKSHITFRFKE